MKSKAFAMVATNITELICSGIPYLFIKSMRLNLLCVLMNGCPLINIGRNEGIVWIFSPKINILIEQDGQTKLKKVWEYLE